jgi:hypothetical protein
MIATKGKRERFGEHVDVFHMVRRKAERAGLFLLGIDSDSTTQRFGARWVFYSRRTGKEVASFWPRPGFYTTAGSSSCNGDAAAALAAAIRAAKAACHV